MRVAVFIDFDDTLFLTSQVSEYFIIQTGKFENVPIHIREFFYSMDKLISSFFLKHIGLCRFRIMTHASSQWIYEALKFMPTILKFVDWNYICVIFCEKQSKSNKVIELIAKEASYDIYVAMGDSESDLQVVDAIVPIMKNCRPKYRQIRFIQKPNLDLFRAEWEQLQCLFLEILQSPHELLLRYFQMFNPFLSGTLTPIPEI